MQTIRCQEMEVAKGKSAKKAQKKENAIVRYLRDTRVELRKVHWPTREEAWNLTRVVLLVTISMAALLGLLDYLFSLELKGLIEGNIVAIIMAVVLLAAGALGAAIINRSTT